MKINITDPSELVDGKKHVVEFEIEPGQWFVVYLTDSEFFDLWFKLYGHAKDKGLFN